MNQQLSTGQAAHILDTTEPRLSDLVRKGKIHPPPTIAVGRRLWSTCHMLQAGALLGLAPEEVRDRLTLAFPVPEATR
jgi:hypothetical protein